MMIVLILSSVFIASGCSAQHDPEYHCDTAELNVCVKQVPKTPIGLPRTKEQLDARCYAFQTGMSCMDKWMKRCLPTDGQKLIQSQIGGARALMQFLCTNETALRKEYLKETTCWSRVSAEWSGCVDDLQLAVREITDRAQLLTYVNRNAELCCARDEFITCVAYVGRLCSANAATLLRRMAWVLAQDVATCSIQPRAYCAATANTGTVMTLISMLISYPLDFV